MCHHCTHPILGNDHLYSEKTREFLATIGPIRRKEAEFAIVKTIIKNILSREGNLLLVEKGLFEKDLGWGEIFNIFSEKK